MFWDNELRKELAELRASGLERYFRILESAPGPRVRAQGREVLVFGSNNYLGLANHPCVLEAANEATRRYGAGVGGSRLTTGNTFLYAELESDLAAFKGTERALVFSSGYAANTGVIPALAREGDLILSDEWNHASLIDGCRLSRAEKRIYRHGDPDFVYFALKDRSNFRRVLIITDGVFSMDGDIAPLPGLCKMAEEFDAGILVDDAHAVGVLGNKGSGAAEHFNLTGHPALIQMGTLSKALGSVGGYVAASEPVIAVVRQKARSFVFSTGLPPGALAAARESLRILRESPQLLLELRANADFLRSEMKRVGFRVCPSETPILRVHIGGAREAVRFSEGCFQRGLWAPAIRPPTVPEGTSRLRLSVMATHTRADIQQAVKILFETGRELRMV